MEEYDLLIIGGGPAGITAGIYGGRANLKTLIVEKSSFGGQMLFASHIENYPGFKRISGSSLTQKMLGTLSLFNIDKVNLKINKIEPSNSSWVVISQKRGFVAKAVIIATGTYPRKLNIKGEDEFLGCGVSYCAVCDGAFFENEKVAVIGGGDSAVQEALFLTQYVSEVFLIHRRDRFRAAKELSQRAENNQKINIIRDSIVNEINGGKMVESITIENVKTAEMSKMPVKGIFIYAGSVPNSFFLGDYVSYNADGFILADSNMSTISKGIFAAGDVREKPLRQISTAVGDGAVAAMSAIEYILSSRQF